MIQKISTDSTRYFTIFLVSDSDVGNCYSMIYYVYQITTVQNHCVLYGFHTKAQVNCWLWIPKGFLHKSNHWMWLSLERTFLQMENIMIAHYRTEDVQYYRVVAHGELLIKFYSTINNNFEQQRTNNCQCFIFGQVANNLLLIITDASMQVLTNGI